MIMKKHFILPLLSILFISGCDQKLRYETTDKAKFEVIPLGTKGGLLESDLSSYLVSPAGKTNFIAFDAGTLMTGLLEAKKKGSFSNIKIAKSSPLSVEGTVMVEHIKAYAISHAHIDHVAGMIIGAPYDSPKPILGLPNTINSIRDHLFNWKIWPNFGNEGQEPLLNKYQYVRLTPNESYPVNETGMSITPYKLSHSHQYISTAFLIESDGAYMLYFGDVGPDLIETSDLMYKVWAAIAPLVRDKKLHAIFLEASFPNKHSDKLLFGHLTPKWMINELQTLSQLVNPEQPQIALQGLNVIVTHIKPTLNKSNSPEKNIMAELSALNNLNVNFILPETGKRIVF